MAYLTVLAALLVPVSATGADSIPVLFAGSWNTSYPPSSGGGTLTLQTTDASHGITAVAHYGGPPTGCSAPTVYYIGAYTSGSDSGQVAGCTTDLTGQVLGGYYGGGPNGNQGSFSIDTSCAAPNGFSGTYTDSSGSTGKYQGTRTGGTPTGCGSPGDGSSGGGGGSTGGGPGTTTLPTPGTSTSGTTSSTGAGTTPPAPPPVSNPVKDAARALAPHLALQVAAGFASLQDASDEDRSDAVVLTFLLVVAFGKNQQVIDDPASGSFLQVSLATAPPVKSPLHLFCAAGCPGAAAAANAYAKQLSMLDSAISGLSTAGDRYSGAKQARSATGMLLQAGVGRAYAGEIADAISGLRLRGAALARALASAGHGQALDGTRLDGLRAQAKNGLSPDLVTALQKQGVSVSTFQQALGVAVSQPASSVSFAQLLAPTQSVAPYVADNHSITAAQVGAVIDGLARQHSLSARVARRLRSELRLHSRLRADIARNVRGAAGLLLHYAAAGLGG